MALKLNQVIGLRVRHARAAAGLTQEGLASRIGRSERAISNIERGTGEPTLETLSRISGVLNVTVASLMADEEGDRQSVALKAELDGIFRGLPPSRAAMLVEIARVIAKPDTA